MSRHFNGRVDKYYITNNYNSYPHWLASLHVQLFLQVHNTLTSLYNSFIWSHTIKGNLTVNFLHAFYHDSVFIFVIVVIFCHMRIALTNVMKTFVSQTPLFQSTTLSHIVELIYKSFYPTNDVILFLIFRVAVFRIFPILQFNVNQCKSM